MHRADLLVNDGQGLLARESDNSGAGPVEKVVGQIQVQITPVFQNLPERINASFVPCCRERVMKLANPHTVLVDGQGQRRVLSAQGFTIKRFGQLLG